jgi:hypothetical protein
MHKPVSRANERAKRTNDGSLKYKLCWLALLQQENGTLKIDRNCETVEAKTENTSMVLVLPLHHQIY